MLSLVCLRGKSLEGSVYSLSGRHFSLLFHSLATLKSCLYSLLLSPLPLTVSIMQASASPTSLKLFFPRPLVTPFCKMQWIHLSHILSSQHHTTLLTSFPLEILFFIIPYLPAFPSISLLYSILHIFTSLKHISILQCSTPTLIVLPAPWVIVISQDRNQERSPETSRGPGVLAWNQTQVSHTTGKKFAIEPSWVLGIPEIEIKSSPQE